MSGNKLLVGAWGENSEAGNAYLFDINTGALLNTFSPAPSSSDRFGWNVSFIDDDILVSHIVSDRMYRIDAETSQVKINYIAPGDSTLFGANLAHDGTTLITGDDNANGGAGSVYVYDIDNGDLLYEIDNPEPGEMNPRFGRVVDMLGDYALIVSSYDSEPETTGPATLGQVYLYDLNKREFLTSTKSPLVVNSSFGGDISFLTNDTFAVSMSNGGLVYVYQIVPEPSSLLLLGMGGILLTRRRR